MKVGIFGGSFNPPHNAHLQLCDYAKKAAFLDKVILIPTGDNPLKKNDDLIERRHRLNMTRLAVEDMDGYEVSDIEIMREGQSFTIDTVRQLKARSEDDFYFISGSDILFQMTRWKDFDELARQICFLSALRRGVNNAAALNRAEEINGRFGASVILLEDFMPDEISSSTVRALAQKDERFDHLIPEKIYNYIRTNHLYRQGC